MPAALLRRKLEALLDGQKPESIAFQPTFGSDAQRAGATLRPNVRFPVCRSRTLDTLLTSEIAIRSFEENLALCLLLGLPHNYSDRLGRQKAAAAPGRVQGARHGWQDCAFSVTVHGRSAGTKKLKE